MTESYLAVSEKPEVSVIIPVYNEAETIKKTLSALLAQDYPRGKFEIIVIDNGSTDNTMNVVSNGFKDVILLTEHNNFSSPYSARNRGLEQSRGNIIVLLDATCIPESNWLRAGISCLEQKKADIVGGNVIFDFEGKVTAGKLCDSLLNIRMEEYITVNNVAVTANLFVRREVFDAVGCFPEGIRSGGDTRWTRKAANAGCKLVFCEKARVVKSARDTREFFKKQWRVGFWIPDAWQERGEEFGVLKVIKQMLIPFGLNTVQSIIQKRGTQQMQKYKYKLLVLMYMEKIVKSAAICAGIMRVRYFSIMENFKK